MKIDIINLVCAEISELESLIAYFIERNAHDLRYKIDPTKIYNELSCFSCNKRFRIVLKNDSTVQRHMTSGWKLLSKSIENIYETKVVEYENICNRRWRAAWI